MARDRITFDELPDMVGLILQKLEKIEALIEMGASEEQRFSKEMLTAEEAANFISVSKSTIYKMSLNRDLPVYKPTGGRIYFKKSDLADYLQQNRFMSQKEIEQEAINYITHGSKVQKRRALRSSKK